MVRIRQELLQFHAQMLALGLVAGIAMTLVLLQRYGSLLEIKNPNHASSIAAACGVLIAAGLAACIVPAIRAARTDPETVLRLE